MLSLFFVMCAAINSNPARAAETRVLSGLFQDEQPQKLNDRAYWKRTFSFTPEDVSIVYSYYDPTDLKTAVLEHRLTGKYHLETIPSAGRRYFRMDVLLNDSSLLQKTWSKLGQGMGLNACAKVHVPVNLHKRGCGEFQRDGGKAFFRLIVEDEKTLLVSIANRSKKRLGPMVSIFPLKKH